jgi:mevalonate kinase
MRAALRRAISHLLKSLTISRRELRRRMQAALKKSLQSGKRIPDTGKK